MENQNGSFQKPSQPEPDSLQSNSYSHLRGSHMSKKRGIVLAFIFIVMLAALFIPIPYYSVEEQWCDSCSLINPNYQPHRIEGWRFGPSITERIIQSVRDYFYSKQYPSTPTTISETQPIVLSPTPNPTANWKTYKNGEFGFEVRYPALLTTSGSLNDKLLFRDSSGKLIIEMSLTSAPGIRCHRDAPKDTCKTISIDKNTEAVVRSFDIAPTEATIQLSDQKVLYIVLPCENSYEEDPMQGVSFCVISPERKALFDQILATFRFLNGTNSGNDGCAIGGCSGELCVESSEAQDAVSICIYRAEYECYTSAQCERQSNGKCGWTQTNELRTCLKSKQNVNK